MELSTTGADTSKRPLTHSARCCLMKSQLLPVLRPGTLPALALRRRTSGFIFKNSAASARLRVSNIIVSQFVYHQQRPERPEYRIDVIHV